MAVKQAKILTSDFYKNLLDSIFDAVYMVDNRGFITYWNKSCERITGFSADEMVNTPYRQTPLAYLDDETQQPVNRHSGIEIVLETGMSGTWKGYLRRKTGQRIPIQANISPIRDETGRIIGVVEVFRDTSALVALEDAHRQALQISRKDQLTSLYNRSAINDILKAEIQRSNRYKQPLSVIMVDIDHFKRINDNYGHDVGDKVLAKIGSILQHNLRAPDVVGRWGGEEFLIITPESTSDEAEIVAQRIRNIIRLIPPPQFPETITASFGVSQLTPAGTHDQLLYLADIALYQAKQQGRDRVVIGYCAP